MRILATTMSLLRRLEIEVSRVTDHTLRRIWGLPLLGNSQISPVLFVGGQYSNRGFRLLQARGITAIVSMRSHLPIDPARYPDMKFLHLPVFDQKAPTVEQLKMGIQFIQQEIDAGGKVYVHCLHGEGRGPTMAIAYLLSTGLTLNDAIAQVKRARSFVQPTRPQLERLAELSEL